MKPYVPDIKKDNRIYVPAERSFFSFPYDFFADTQGMEISERRFFLFLVLSVSLSHFRMKHTLMHIKMEDTELTCLECGKALYGRSDKKFCSCECKNRYHNLRNKDSRRIRNRIITDLSSNYEILENLLKLKIRVISVCDAEAMGFKSAIITGYSKEKGHNEYRCFDIKYCQSPTRIFNIGRVQF